MPSFLPDTSFIIPTVCTWHVHHQAAYSEMAGRLQSGERLVLAGHTLIEAYSVLTRLPREHRFEPVDAKTALVENFLTVGTVVTLSPEEYLSLLVTLAQRRVRGGAAYDGLIAACANAADVDTLLTFNARHFQLFESPGLAILDPSR